MLFTKKKIFAVSEKVFKEELKDEKGEVLVRINLKLPQIQCPKKDALLKKALPFYEKLGEGILQFAKGELADTAKKAKSVLQDNFKPFAAVSRFEITFESEEYLSVLIDFSVSDGISNPSVERKTQVWDRKTGMLCRVTDFIAEKTVIEKIGMENKKRFSKNLFTMRENRIEIFLQNKNYFESVVFQKEICANS